jgi:hypothetical protein
LDDGCGLLSSKIIAWDLSQIPCNYSFASQARTVGPSIIVIEDLLFGGGKFSFPRIHDRIFASSNFGEVVIYLEEEHSSSNKRIEKYEVFLFLNDSLRVLLRKIKNVLRRLAMLGLGLGCDEDLVK